MSEAFMAMTSKGGVEAVEGGTFGMVDSEGGSFYYIQPNETWVQNLPTGRDYTNLLYSDRYEAFWCVLNDTWVLKIGDKVTIVAGSFEIEYEFTTALYNGNLTYVIKAMITNISKVQTTQKRPLAYKVYTHFKSRS